MGVISPQKASFENNFSFDFQTINSSYLRCVEPNYRQYLDPLMARRMSRTIKMGIVSATQCVADAGQNHPDAIITGTALGGYESTGKFLKMMLEENEQFLTPTLFAQSTGNMVSAQAAMILGCTGYNHTYMHKGFSFESALLDGLMHIAEGTKHILVGGHEEQTEENFEIYNRTGFWKKETENTPLWQSQTPGTISGEGSAFFMLSGEKTTRSYARLTGVEMLYQPNSITEIAQRLDLFLAHRNLSVKEIDFVLLGYNGDQADNEHYNQLREKVFSANPAGAFKHLCGEYQTATSFALWLAASILFSQTIPHKVELEPSGTAKKIRNVLIYNRYRLNNHSFILLETA